MKFFKSLIYKYIIKKRVHTVHLRGRLSDERQALLDSYKGKKVFDVAGLKHELVHNQKPVVVEIGFGNGSHVLHLAKSYNSSLVVGVEMFREGLVKTLEKSVKRGLDNLILIPSDARDVVTSMKQKSVSAFYILFPDPWPKKKHNKRRLLKKAFFEELLTKLEKKGEIVVATDWAEYGEEIEELLQKLQKEKKGLVSNLESERQKPITETTFAVRAKKEGRDIYIRKFTKEA